MLVHKGLGRRSRGVGAGLGDNTQTSNAVWSSSTTPSYSPTPGPTFNAPDPTIYGSSGTTAGMPTLSSGGVSPSQSSVGSGPSVLSLLSSILPGAIAVGGAVAKNLTTPYATITSTPYGTTESIPIGAGGAAGSLGAGLLGSIGGINMTSLLPIILILGVVMVLGGEKH